MQIGSSSVDDYSHLIYLHGSENNSNSGKARLFREWFPGMLTPDFTGSFDQRMAQLRSILSDKTDWTLIGSSYGGLMGTVFTLDHEAQVRKLVLLAPALRLDPLASRSQLRPVSVPTIIVHGTADDVVPLEPVREIAQRLFTDLTYFVVDDRHRLQKAVHELDWKKILA
ncbi:MAG TPA: YqiA/YcfP family alpha/beta fold hydrolase [Anaerolineales bacterium]|nr:YqiA/YcfP family alpha/beta fold hydrolase [Anaerolineales bacterium]